MMKPEQRLADAIDKLTREVTPEDRAIAEALTLIEDGKEYLENEEEFAESLKQAISKLKPLTEAKNADRRNRVEQAIGNISLVLDQR